MFKVGDIIRIKKDCYFYNWYSTEEFVVIGYLTNDIILIDRNLNALNSSNNINIAHVEYSPTQFRIDKIKKIKERLCGTSVKE